MLLLGIETSCDETAMAIVSDGITLLSNVIGSQIDEHNRYGGIVPEVASRQHMLSVLPIFHEAMASASIDSKDLDGIAVTMGPGLAGSLLVGVNFAKGLALGLGVPLFGVNHLEGHIYATWLEDQTDPGHMPGFPLVCLLASGGHTELVLMKDHKDYQRLGSTRDDAAGEAFDKAARVLGVGFPGGPQIQRLSGQARWLEPMPRAWLEGSLEFSFSGLKSAFIRRVHALSSGFPAATHSADASEHSSLPQAELAAGFQEAVVDVLVGKTLMAVRQHSAKGVIMGGGVAANSRLRQLMWDKSHVPVFVPQPILCTDNGAMVAAAADFLVSKGLQPSLDFDATPNLRLE